MGEAKIFFSPCETNVLHPVIRIEVTASGRKKLLCLHFTKILTHVDQYF